MSTLQIKGLPPELKERLGQRQPADLGVPVARLLGEVREAAHPLIHLRP
ncbi:hypothetical protein [Thermus caliditerrae]|nr:hypothetical protein [Thermus caliditerrae]